MTDHRVGRLLHRGLLAGAAAFGLVGLLTVDAGAQTLAMADRQVTFAADVATIIQQNCQVCHRPGGIGPMSLTNYDEIKPWAGVIRMKVSRGEMPPYAYDRNVGIQDLKDDWRLSEDEINTILAWVDQGAPLGNPADLPAPISLPDPTEWRLAASLGQPDVVVGVPDITVPANGNDMWYRPMLPTNLPTERCIKAVQVKPGAGAAAVVHHANTTLQTVGADGEYEQAGRLSEYAMGKYAEIIPEGVCRPMPANSYVSWDIHLFPGGIGGAAQGKEVSGNVVEVGVWLHPEGYQAKYKQDLRLYSETDGELIIPPGGTTMTIGYHTFDHPVRVDSYQPHGHLRLRHASLEILNPANGQSEVISVIQNWSATWHHSHVYQDDVAPLVPAGHVLVIKQWYDNSADNPNNPDPTLWVVGGSRTADEMSHAWIAITHLDQEGYDALVETRKAKTDGEPATAAAPSTVATAN